MEKLNIKKDNYLKLNPIERQLKSALLSNFARLSAKEFDMFCEVYKELYGTGLTPNEKNCNTCRLKALKKVANDYFDYKEWYESRFNKSPETNEDINDNDNATS